jgi:hypothetical protein
MNIRDGIYNRSQLWSNDKGRDYIRIGDEIYSINGLYVDEKGNPDRWGRHVKIVDIRWVVLAVNSHTRKLTYQGDQRDVAALDHWDYDWPGRRNSGDEIDRMPRGEDRERVTPAKGGRK